MEAVGLFNASNKVRVDIRQPLETYKTSLNIRLDVINLQEQLDQKLQQRQARETGICQVE